MSNQSEPPSSATRCGCFWDIQEILAERTSTRGEKELLIVWKTSWIPKEQMIANGPVMRRYMEARKWNFETTFGVITLPVEPGTSLQRDCDIAELEDEIRRDYKLQNAEGGCD